jgi:hypothetical protein
LEIGLFKEYHGIFQLAKIDLYPHISIVGRKSGRNMALKRRFSLLVRLLLVILVTAAPSRAEDADRFRPYFRFHFGNISSLWDVDDLWSFALGANFDRHWGCELGIDSYEQGFSYDGKFLGEVSGLLLVPQARLLKTFLNGRLVPYVLAGAGVSLLQFNDAKEPAFGRRIEIEGSAFTMSAGTGMEYFVADNVSLGIEGRYFWQQPVSGKVDGQSVKVDLSAPAFTWGMRAYIDENRFRPPADAGPESPGRFYLSIPDFCGFPVRRDLTSTYLMKELVVHRAMLVTTANFSFA